MASSSSDSNTKKYCISFDDVQHAAERIKGTAHQTPVLSSTTINELIDGNNQQQLFFKVEALQKTGSFKFRGALNAIRSELEHQQKNDNSNQVLHVVTHSSGNHAQAVALAAKLSSTTTKRQVQSTIVMPNNCPIVKRNAVAGYGGNIVLVENTPQARKEAAEKIMRNDTSGNTIFIHPSEHPNVIAGQGTTCLEFINQMKEQLASSSDPQSSISSSPPLDVVIIPVGGGGLAAGNTTTLRALLGKSVKVRNDIWFFLL